LPLRDAMASHLRSRGERAQWVKRESKVGYFIGSFCNELVCLLTDSLLCIWI